MPTAIFKPLSSLAQSFKNNHDDSWVFDFLHYSRFSSAANTFLLQAIHSDYAGDADAALQAAIQAEELYRHVGNRAGALRSQFEQLYALRRLSQSANCRQLAPKIVDLSSQLHYRWIEVQTIIEQSSCEGMEDHADTSWALARTAAEKARTSNYHILYLRALGLRGNLDMIEGRSDASWTNNEDGLRRFWQDAFPDERGFQLYYNLQVDAEKNGAIYLALTLQKETLSMITGLARFDFEAMAHFRMASAAQAVGDSGTSQREIILYRNLIAKLPETNGKTAKAKGLYEAYCEIGLAHLAIQSGNQAEARQHLTNATPIASQTENFMLRLDYLKARTALDRLSKDIREEQKDLNEITFIANEGFRSLKSVIDRWRWRNIVQETYRRLMEIELSSSHSPTHAFGYWEFHRQLESAPSLPPMNSAALANLEYLTSQHISKLHGTTLVSFAVLANKVVAWVVDDRGIQEYKLSVDPIRLKAEARRFYSLCSDPNSSIEKVNLSGLRLYQWLIEPFERALADDRTVLIEPDAFLGSIPWAALRTPKGHYLGIDRAVAMGTGLFSNSPGEELHARLPVKNVTIAIPNSLTLNGQSYLRPVGADEEAVELKKLYPQTKVLPGTDVTPPNILSEFQNADIFEFAGHAITREHGGELVVQGENEGTIVSGVSLANLRLKHTRLVVLSACSTGATSDAGRDPNGLVKALINAGAEHVIATRWDVDSQQTADFTKLFYRSLKGGMGEIQAIQVAHKSISMKNTFAHPYYWAGVELFNAN